MFQHWKISKAIQALFFKNYPVIPTIQSFENNFWKLVAPLYLQEKNQQTKTKKKHSWQLKL